MSIVILQIASPFQKNWVLPSQEFLYSLETSPSLIQICFITAVPQKSPPSLPSMEITYTRIKSNHTAVMYYHSELLTTDKTQKNIDFFPVGMLCFHQKDMVHFSSSRIETITITYSCANETQQYHHL